ncbi:hypothetical protein PC129_g7728 [Phytophthora cactorum]|uniref:Uncharacterized protein n=2 Tax=Phytophthora cactorum TaxID=29920 RepID=A0A8T0Z713_9STRA|nr:hypothetical protein Pcac1_g12990 [Phytophthora cactorum]KAG2825056.1 hypothetical protein PC112_g9854 [Phytophthora cactorum]KAG2826948.1 hypothetical protein PC111_g8766 [Phytophthora cactorum]KAG2858044.1 hypothetical protein PC113_g10138 [Phytophthora cactorum]KAG2899582.1 hypothetical protein PC115_g16491 [Phytophthora cactorum]
MSKVGESPAIVMRPAINAINRRLLKAFCELELKTPVDQMTNDKLINAIDQILASMINEQIPNVHLIMSQHLRMYLRQKDAKLKCKLLIENLKEQVQLYTDLDATVKINASRLFDVMKTEALKNQQSFDLYQTTRDKPQPRDKATVASSDYRRSPSCNQVSTAGDERRDDKPAFRKRDNVPAHGCLHCKGTHWVSECPTATEEQKKQAHKTFMEQRKGAEPAKMKQFMHEGEKLAPKHVAFNGVVTMPYHLDNGTKYNVIPRRVVNPDVTATRLSKPIDDEFLLGYLTLKALGIDVGEQLAALANKEVVDFDPFESTIPMCFDPPDKKAIITRLWEPIRRTAIVTTERRTSLQL